MPDSVRGLVYRPGSLGDTLVSLPAIAEIRRRHPEHRLTLLTESQVAGSTRVSPWIILKETGWFEDVCFYVVKPESVADRWHNLSLALRLRGIGYHDIFSLAPPRTTRQLRVDSSIFRGVVGARRYHAACRPAWPPSSVDPAHVEHEGLRLLRIVDPAANGDALDNFRLLVPASEQELGRGLLNELGVRPDQMLIGVGPGSGRSATTWPAERFAALGSALLDQFGNMVLLAIGGSRERGLCDELCAAWGPRSHNLAGRLSVFGSASVLSQCATFIGNDSGPTHLAAMVGIPCVAIFSARNAPGQWQPLGAHHIVLEDRPECAGCMLDDCVHEAKKCLTRIETGRVVREAISLIESRGSLRATTQNTRGGDPGPCLAH
jgi:ADP-heptose:LPS heptosyltransferase